MRPVMVAGFSAVATSLSAIALAPASTADPTTDFKSAVAAARGGCPALQSDPVLDGLALRANTEMQSYAQHTARFIPFDNPQLMPILREMGYQAGKAKLLVGYGDTDPRETAPATPAGKAIHGVITEGYEFIPDCAYTKYGVNILTNPSGGSVLAASILASA